MFFAKIPRHTRQNAIAEGDLECILTRNCEGTEQLRIVYKKSQGPYPLILRLRTCFLTFFVIYFTILFLIYHSYDRHLYHILFISFRSDP